MRTYYKCRCDCGQQIVVDAGALRSANTRSCGCLRIDLMTSHGLSDHPLRDIWRLMNDRCHKPTHKQYHYYGGRGIFVCDEWRGRFGLAQFIRDMGKRPKGFTIDRIDNNGPYTKANCRWASYTTQERNRRNNRLLTMNGKTACIAEWAEMRGLSSALICWRLKHGKTVEEALRPGQHWSRGEGRVRNAAGRFIIPPASKL